MTSVLKDGDPCRVGIAMTDMTTGLYAHGAVMAALIERQRTGRGQKIDCSLLSSQVQRIYSTSVFFSS